MKIKYNEIILARNICNLGYVGYAYAFEGF